MPSLRYFVLGLLAQKSMSGYDIKCLSKSFSWLIGSPSTGSLYPILRALLEENLVTMEVVPGLGKPPRKIYSIAETGTQVLQAWIDQPLASDAPLKAFAMRLLLAGSVPPARLIAHLKQRRVQVAAHHAALIQAAGTHVEGMDLGQRLTLEYGLAMATAELGWLDTALNRLSAKPLPEKAVQSGTLTN